MKFIIPAFTFLIGLAVGWFFFTQSAKSILKEHFPEKLHEDLMLAHDYFGSLSKEEFIETINLMKDYNSHAREEADFMAVWSASVAYRYNLRYSNKGAEGLSELVDEDFERFKEAYENGGKFGDWQELAEVMYKKVKERENQAVDTTPVSAPR